MTYTNQADKIYAQSLLELDADKKLILDELIKVEEVFTSSPELINILKNPTISISIRTEILENIFKDKINDKLYKFLEILVEKNRINRLKEITESYKLKFNTQNNIKDIEIISAIELDEKHKEKIIKTLEKKFNKVIMPKWNINPEIIGGLIYKIGDSVIDTSIRHKLEKFIKIMK
jgi:F-type H+-transporting ATPase subunit delta